MKYVANHRRALLIYGGLIKNFDLKNSPNLLLEHLVQLLETMYKINIEIDWELERKNAVRDKNDSKKDSRRYNKSSRNSRESWGEYSRASPEEREELDKWLEEIGF